MNLSPNVRPFARVLGAGQLEFDAIDLADMLWLAQFMPSAEAGDAEPDEPELQAPRDRSIEREDIEPSASEPSAPILPPSPAMEEDDEGDHEDTTAGTPFAVPAAPAIRAKLELARALRPLMRKAPSPNRFELDEDATATRIAETEVWMPVQRPRQERWLDLDLVVEDSKSTAIWERTIAELKHLVEYQGAFRTVRTWRLSESSARNEFEPLLLPGWYGTGESAGERSARPRNPSELVDARARRAIWVVSDCVSRLWQVQPLNKPGGIYDWLDRWGQSQPVAIVQMFPSRLWSRTALRRGYTVQFGALAPGLANSRLEVRGLPRRLVRRQGAGLANVPIVTLEAESLGRWSQAIAGSSGANAFGRTFDVSPKEESRRGRRREAAASEEAAAPALSPPTAQERVARFRASATPTVLKLATLMAATPVSLPVVDLLRREFAGEFERAGLEPVAQHHVAEVLMSGLLRRCDRDDERVVRYEFWGDELAEPHERVRDILLGGASISETERVLNVLSGAIAERLGLSVERSFEAVLGAIGEAEGEVRELGMPFARVTLGVLRRLGGEYGYGKTIDKISSLYKRQFNSQHQTKRRLKRFDFFVAQIVLKEVIEGNVSIDVQASIRRTKNHNWGYSETLTKEVELDLVLIPAQSFMQGSCINERSSYTDEQPQRLVHIPPFFCSCYTITQKQWRIVATYECIDRTLSLSPSHFDNDDCPVENVSWEDAVEFCKRLSKKTGRIYRLPTESEWECACHSETATPFHFGGTLTAEIANYNARYTYRNIESSGVYRQRTLPVGSLISANKWGVYDMHGNVWEWCSDRWHENYKNAPSDGQSWDTIENSNSANRVLRGGAWNEEPWQCRTKTRNYNRSDFKSNNVGFRIVTSNI